MGVSFPYAPKYDSFLVVPGASTSSPGLAFLLATISEYGEQWPAYWEDLMRNGAKVVKADVAASNGVIHVIDTVLLPKAKGTM